MLAVLLGVEFNELDHWSQEFFIDTRLTRSLHPLHA
jgi:hypothetical protein